MFVATAAIGARLADIAFAAAASNSSSPLNTFNMTGVSFGAEAARRQMLAIVRGANANLVSDTNYTTSVTIGGVGATRIYDPGVASIQHWTAWMTARTEDGGPSGASGNVAVTRSTGNGYNTVGVTLFALYDLRDPSLAFFDADEDSANPTASIAIDLPGGGLIAAMAHAVNATAHTWTGATEVADGTGGVGGSQRFSAAMDSRTPGTAGHTITTGNGASFMNLLGLSFR